MELFVIIEEKINIPIAIFDSFEKAKQCLQNIYLFMNIKLMK